MRTEVTLPELGEGVTDGFVVEWLVAVGERVTEDHLLVEVMTDKANIEIPSPVSGTLVEQGVGKDDRVKVGQVIAVIEVAES